MLHFHHNDFYFGLVVLLLCSFHACWLCYLCSCWYFSFGLLLLDVNFLFLHFSYVVVLLALPYCVVVGVSCGLLLLFLSRYSSCTIFIHYCSSHFQSFFGCSSHCWSCRVTTPFMLLLFSHCSSCPAILLTLLHFSCCSSCIVAPFAFQAIAS